MSAKRHFTTRRDFIGTMGFGALGLYGTWAAYGASPVPFASSPPSSDPHAGHGAAGGHGGHEEPAIAEAHAPSRMTPAEFQTRHAEFVASNTQPDGSVKPTPPSNDHVHDDHDHSTHDHGTTAPMAEMKPTEQKNGPSHEGMQTASDAHAGHDMHAGHAMPMPHDMGNMPPMSAMRDMHAGHAMPMPQPQPDSTHDMHAMHARAPAASPTAPTQEMPKATPEHDHSHTEGPIEVFLGAGRFAFEPSDLRLEKGRTYRFHMMATDVAHGASIAFGRASRIVRLRPDTVTTLDLTFAEAGRHLIYCTVYCGPGHDGMRASITVG